MEAILTINSGSSTIKFSIFSVKNKNREINREYYGLVDHILTRPNITIKSPSNDEKISEVIKATGGKETYYQQAIEWILQWINAKKFNLVAAGHRIVHGGPDYSAPCILDDHAIKKLLAYAPIMPLHQPFNIKGVTILKQKLPNLIQIACFDTAFHATCNPIAQHFALPKYITAQGVRRYGFHGLSYEYIASQLPNYMSEQQAKDKFIIAHLGNGATMCALANQKSVATSIGFTGVGGIPMGTRCDSLDPGCVLYLIDAYNLNTEQMRDLIYKKSGLLGVSELSSDMRDLLASDKPEAKLAIDIFVHRVAIHAGMLVAELQGCDGFIFTAGIGENAPSIREQVCEKLSWLGISLDKCKNQQKLQNGIKISNKKSKIPVWIIHTDEELMIAKHTQNLLTIAG